MKRVKQCALAAVLFGMALLLSACAGGEGSATPTPALQQAAMEITVAPTVDTSSYDPASEEDSGAVNVSGSFDEYGNSLTAGATAIPLDPIDMPTATPRPELAFTYTEYTSDKLGIKFEIPGSWTVDDTQEGKLIFTDPEKRDNVNATLTISITSVASNFGLSDVKTSLKNELSTIGQFNYVEWKTENAAPQTLIKCDGYYNTYRGVLYDGTIIRGRVGIALLEGNKVITVHLSAPGWYNSDFQKVYAQFRNTCALV